MSDGLIHVNRVVRQRLTKCGAQPYGVNRAFVACFSLGRAQLDMQIVVRRSPARTALLDLGSIDTQLANCVGQHL